MKIIYIIDSDGVYLDNYLYNETNNTYYDGSSFVSVDNVKFTTNVPPICNKCRWDGSKWIIIEECKKDTSLPINSQDKLNAELLKQNAELKAEIDKQKQLNSQVLLELAKLKQGGGANV